MLRTKRTSSASSTIPELVVIAQNSCAIERFQNTGGGINALSTYALQGRIVVTGSGPDQQLRLLWKEWDEKRDETEDKIEVNNGY